MICRARWFLRLLKRNSGIKGDTASGGTKPATLETGAVVRVPFFVNVGDKLKINTKKWRLYRTGISYYECMGYKTNDNGEQYESKSMMERGKTVSTVSSNERSG